MFGVLAKRSFRDSWPMLLGCGALACGFVALKVIATSKINIDSMLLMLSENLKFFEDLLPVSIKDLASPLGRTAFSFEELPVAAATGLWVIARGTDCIVGRIGAGTMEMLLAQPVRRSTLVASHAFVTIFGAILLALATWLGAATGLAAAAFDPSPDWRSLWPAAANLVAADVFLLGAATFLGAVSRTRSQAVGWMMSFYVVEIALMILSRLSPDFRWLAKLTFVSAYEPTVLTLGLTRDAANHWSLFWQHELVLLGLGTALFAVALAIFSRRDVPAPL